MARSQSFWPRRSQLHVRQACGKSVLAEDLGLHVAAGWPWHGRPVRRGAVLYIALERGKLIERRAIALREKHGIRDLPFAIIGGVYDFRDKRTAKLIIEIARQVEMATGEPVVLIIIDTLSRGLCGGDENSSTWAPSSPVPGCCSRARPLTSCGFTTSPSTGPSACAAMARCSAQWILPFMS
jgi:hypothetical protein